MKSSEDFGGNVKAFQGNPQISGEISTWNFPNELKNKSGIPNSKSVDSGY